MSRFLKKSPAANGPLPAVEVIVKGRLAYFPAGEDVRLVSVDPLVWNLVKALRACYPEGPIDYSTRHTMERCLPEMLIKPGFEDGPLLSAILTALDAWFEVKNEEPEKKSQSIPMPANEVPKTF